MPYSIHANHDGTFRVVNTETGEVHGKRMTKKAAKNQFKLLNAIEHGYNPEPQRGFSTWAEVARLDPFGKG